MSGISTRPVLLKSGDTEYPRLMTSYIQTATEHRRDRLDRHFLWTHSGHAARKTQPLTLPFRQVRGCSVLGGRYWVRTSDLFGVNEARYHCANRPGAPKG